MNKKAILGERKPFVPWRTLIIVCACLLTFTSPVRADDKPKIKVGPYLQHVTKTSMTIMWETDKPCTSTIKFGKSRFVPKGKKGGAKPSAPLDQQVSSEETNTIHELVLSDLEPQTDYFYQVHSRFNPKQEVKSEILPFQTAVKDDSAFAYVVMGDNRTYPERFKKLTQKAFAERPNFVLNVGDVVSNGNNKDQWITEYLSPAAELMKRVPTYVAIGNHERNASWFYRYSSYPSPENYYSFDYGNAHFTIIDSNADLSPKSKQLMWIKKDLAASKAKWKFVAHHHPPFSSDKDDYGNTDYSLSRRGDPRVQSLISIYEKYGVDVVWCGHIHDYERTWPIRDGAVDQNNGVIYIQAGGGGAPLEEFAPTRSWFTAKVLRNWQYCLVTIHAGTFRMMAYDINGNMYDYLELKKNAEPKDSSNK
jgi:hypothetical protein